MIVNLRLQSSGRTVNSLFTSLECEQTSHEMDNDHSNHGKIAGESEERSGDPWFISKRKDGENQNFLRCNVDFLFVRLSGIIQL
jgi:hypothetical protein